MSYTVVKSHGIVVKKVRLKTPIANFFLEDTMEVDSNLADDFKNLNKESIEFKKKCTSLVKEINSGQTTIVQIVEQLGPLLTNVSSSSRELGMWILTQVLENLPSNHFDSKRLDFICTFYSDRLKDHHQIIPAVLAGIVALTRFQNVPEGAATKILKALFQNVACQQQQEHDRHNIYKIFVNLLDKCALELCQMGIDYVYGVISAVDSERNPKNLILLFNWFPKFLKTVDLGHLTEEAFEILACYFPVDFKAPTQDENSISREQLANSLAPCLIAIPGFAEFCLSLALEKLDSSLEIAKLDSLKLLEAGCSSFNMDSYMQHSTEIWSQIQKELFNNPTPAVESASLSTLTSVIKKISDDPNITAIIRDILDTVKRNLLPDSKLFEPSSKLLLGVASASKIPSDIVTKEILPILINTFNISISQSHKILFLRKIVDFYETYLSLHKEIEFDELNKVPYLCLKASLDDNSNLRTIGFESLTQIAAFLPKDIRQSLYENLHSLLLIPKSGDVKEAILKCFESLARNYPGEVAEQISDIVIPNGEFLAGFLEALCIIAHYDNFGNIFVNNCLKYLNTDLSLSPVVIISLKQLLVEYETNEMIQRALLENNMIDILVDFSLHHDDTLEAQYLEMIAFILKSIIRNLSVEKQTVIVQTEISKIELLKPQRIFLVYGILCCLRQEVEIDYKLLNDITHLSIGLDDSVTKECAAQLIANLVNKCSNEDVLQCYLNQCGENNGDVVLTSWITKALVMRNHEKAISWTNQLLKLLDNDISIVPTFGTIINDNFDSLSTKSYCKKSVLYRQKFFNYVSNILNKNYTSEKNNYLSAFGYLLEHTPKQVILLQFKKLFKLIILCLDKCYQSEVLIVILNIIHSLIIEKSMCIEEHLSDLLTRFLHLSKFDKSMKVRILAVQCLKEITSFPIYKLLIHRQEVLSTLGKVIDDKKRIVRREAVETRLVWFLLDSPE